MTGGWGLHFCSEPPSIIPAFSSVSSDHRPGGGPSSSRHCLAVGPGDCLTWPRVPVFSAQDGGRVGGGEREVGRGQSVLERWRRLG